MLEIKFSLVTKSSQRSLVFSSNAPLPFIEVSNVPSSLLIIADASISFFLQIAKRKTNR